MGWVGGWGRDKIATQNPGGGGGGVHERARRCRASRVKGAGREVQVGRRTCGFFCWAIEL